MKGRLAQLVEQRIYTAKVGGSNPSSPTDTQKRPKGLFCFFVPPVGIEPTLEV